MSALPVQKNDHDAAKEPYNNLKHFFAQAHSLFHIKSILGMDMMTVMPPRGMPQRIADITGLTKRVYAETITPQVRTALEKTEHAVEANPENWDEWDRRNLQEMRWMYDHLAAVPPDLFLASLRASNEGRQRYSKAVKENDWNGIKPWLKFIIEVTQRTLSYKQNVFGTQSHYETLLYGYVRDMKAKDIDTLFTRLVDPLRSITAEAHLRKNITRSPRSLGMHLSQAEQKTLCAKLLADLGFDFERGVLSTTASSASAGGHRNETRILIRCQDGDDVRRSIADTLYQGAKGLYIQGLPEPWIYQPVGYTPELVLMEAHSILLETMLGRAPYFLTYLVDTATAMFPYKRTEGFDADNLYRLATVTGRRSTDPGADELTGLELKLTQARIEKDLINGTLTVDDLPERWEADSVKLGVRPPDAAQGVLHSQDWYIGRFGYFSATLLAHMGAAQLEAALFKAHSDLPAQIASGDFGSLTGWLQTHLYAKGRSKGGLELMEEVTGGKLGEKPLLDHLRRRYVSEKS